MVGWWGAGRAQDRASSVSGPGTWPPLSPQPASFTLLQQQVLFIHPTLPLPPKTSPALFPPAHWQGRGVYRFMCLAENRTLPTLLCLAVLNPLHLPRAVCCTASYMLTFILVQFLELLIVMLATETGQRKHVKHPKIQRNSSR